MTKDQALKEICKIVIAYDKSLKIPTVIEKSSQFLDSLNPMEFKNKMDPPPEDLWPTWNP